MKSGNSPSQVTKYNLGTRAGKYKLGARVRGWSQGMSQGWGQSKGPGARKYKDPKKLFLFNMTVE